MGSVPNTTTFTLQDVLNVTGGSDLVAAFANSTDSYFDPAYKGSKNNLLNFRNYQEEAIVQPDVTVEVLGEESFTMVSLGGVGTIGNTSLTFGFTNVANWSSSPANMNFEIYDALSNYVGGGYVAGVYNSSSIEWIKSTTLNRAAVSGDVFRVYLGNAV